MRKEKSEGYEFRSYHADSGLSVLVSGPIDAILEEMCIAFASFLRAGGYYLHPSATVEIVNQGETVISGAELADMRKEAEPETETNGSQSETSPDVQQACQKKGGVFLTIDDPAKSAIHVYCKDCLAYMPTPHDCPHGETTAQDASGGL